MERNRDISMHSVFSAELPPQYANFQALDRPILSIGTIRDEAFPEHVYEDLWTRLCMMIDEPKQRELIARLRHQLRQEDYLQHPNLVQTYWSELTEASSHPVYQRIRTDLERERYSENVLERQKWVKLRVKWNLDSIDVLNRASEIYPVIPFSIRTELGRSINLRYKYVFKELEEKGAGHLIGYAFSIVILNQVRTFIEQQLLRQIDNFEQVRKGKLQLIIPDIELKITEFLRRVEPFYFLSEQLSDVLKKKELELFGDSWEAISTLWRTAILLRTSKLPERKRLSPIKTLIDFLVDKEYKQASYYLEELAVTYPGSVPTFVERKLNLESMTLRQLLESEDETKILKSKEEKRKQQLSLEQIKNIVGRKLVSPNSDLVIIVNETQNHYFSIKVIQGQEQLEGLVYKAGLKRPQDILSIIDLFNLIPEID